MGDYSFIFNGHNEFRWARKPNQLPGFVSSTGWKRPPVQLAGFYPPPEGQLVLIFFRQ